MKRPFQHRRASSPLEGLQRLTLPDPPSARTLATPPWFAPASHSGSDVCRSLDVAPEVLLSPEAQARFVGLTVADRRSCLCRAWRPAKQRRASASRPQAGACSRPTSAFALTPRAACRRLVDRGPGNQVKTPRAPGSGDVRQAPLTLTRLSEQRRHAVSRRGDHVHRRVATRPQSFPLGLAIREAQLGVGLG